MKELEFEKMEGQEIERLRIGVVVTHMRFLKADHENMKSWVGRVEVTEGGGWCAGTTTWM